MVVLRSVTAGWQCSPVGYNSETFEKMIQQGGVQVDGEKVGDIDFCVSKDALVNGVKIRKGKKVFHKAIAK